MTNTQIHDPTKAKAFFEDKISFTTGPVELQHMLKSDEDIVVVDVRDAEDFAKGHIPGALNLPRNSWANPQGLEKGKLNIVYCYTQTCHLAAKACAWFAGKGYPVMEMEGGFEAWRGHQFDVEREPVNRMKASGGMKASGDRLRHRRR